MDATEQEIEKCYHTINDIQLTIDNRIDNINNATYEQQQIDLKILQASEWARIKHLCWEICAIHENNDNIIESKIRSDLNQSHPELCTSLQTLLRFLESKSLQITHHHPEFWLQVVNIDNELATNNIIILTKYIHNILLTAITPITNRISFSGMRTTGSNFRDNFPGHTISTPSAMK